MPQKKNPDILELIRGKTGKTYGNLQSLLVMMKGLPLAYNKDMQEDKEIIFDSIDIVKECIYIIIPVLDTLKVNSDKMKNASLNGFINATDCADYLTKNGIPFRDAYKITGNIIAYCIDHNKNLEILSLEEYKSFNEIFDEDIYDAINLDNCVQKRNVVGGPSKEQVETRINEIKLLM